MKRIILILTVAAVSFTALTGCGKTRNNSTDYSGTNADTQNKVEQNSSSTEITEGVPMTLKNCIVTYRGSTLATDWSKKDAIILSFDFQNTSNDKAMFSTSVGISLYQDGIELEPAMVSNSSVYDSGSAHTNILSGTVLPVQRAYVLVNTTSPIQFEIGEWISFGGSQKYTGVINF